MLFDSSQLSYVKSQWQAGAEPFRSAYINAENFYLTRRTNATGPTLSNGSIACGYFSHPDDGCTAESTDLEAAVIQSYLWAIGGNVTYAEQAIAILDHYGQTLTGYVNLNAPLQAAWSSLKYARAAEILVHTGAPWDPADVATFKDMLYRAVLPSIYNGSCFNGNWELAMIEGMGSIAVFTENSTLWDHALAMWRARVPAYFYIHTDGPAPNRDPECGLPWWYGQSVFNASVDGVCQETCRDFGHMSYGLASSFNFAETARIQGLNLYAEQSDRLQAALEFHATILNEAAANPGVNITNPLYCNGTVLKVYDPPTFQVGLTAFSRCGIELPQTKSYVQNILWASKQPTEMFMAIFEPLTHGGTNSTDVC